MRLLLTWLLGVPLLVGSMVLARAALAPAPRHTVQQPVITAQACLQKMEFNRMPLVVPQQRNRGACDIATIH